MRLTYRTELEGSSPEEVFAWHERPGALERLTPPWADVEVLEHPESLDGGRAVLRIRRGPATVRWELRHTDYEPGRGFSDEQVAGPLAKWRHTHRFLPREGGGCVVEDEVEVEPPLGAAGAALGPGLIRRELDRLFAFRHRRLRTDLARHAEHADRPRMTVAITGSSGLIGTRVRHFLTTGGHEVVRVLRDRRGLRDGDAYWNPDAGEIEADRLVGVDAVVHLAGASIAAGRWTEARKRRIRESRVRGTELIARTLAELSEGPRTLVSASAVGYYGDRGSEPLTEAAGPGRGFLAEVCRAWEAATRAAERAGQRVVVLRNGVVLSPAGGALGQMLFPFKMGMGGRIGSGDQYVSWVDLDDLVALIHRALQDDRLSGPVNGTAPYPVTNATFTSALGRVLGRPTLLPVPALAVRAAFGQLGREALLEGQRVLPRKAEAVGFSFFYEGVEESLRFQLGRMAEHPSGA